MTNATVALVSVEQQRTEPAPEGEKRHQNPLTADELNTALFDALLSAARGNQYNYGRKATLTRQLVSLC